MVVSAAADHGMLLERAQPWSRLAGVDDACPPGGGLDKGVSLSGDSAHALAEVQRDPFGLQHRPSGAGDRGKHLTCSESVSVGGGEVDRDALVDECEGTGEDLDPGEHPVFAGTQIGRRRGCGGDEDFAGEIAPGASSSRAVRSAESMVEAVSMRWPPEAERWAK